MCEHVCVFWGWERSQGTKQTGCVFDEYLRCIPEWQERPAPCTLEQGIQTLWRLTMLQYHVCSCNFVTRSLLRLPADGQCGPRCTEKPSQKSDTEVAAIRCFWKCGWRLTGWNIPASHAALAVIRGSREQQCTIFFFIKETDANFFLIISMYLRKMRAPRTIRTKCTSVGMRRYTHIRSQEPDRSCYNFSVSKGHLDKCGSFTPGNDPKLTRLVVREFRKRF